MTRRNQWERKRAIGRAARLEAVADAIVGLAVAREFVLQRIDRQGWTEEAHSLEVSMAVTIGDLVALQSRLCRDSACR